MVKKSARRTHRTHNPFFKARVALAALIAMARGFVYLKAVVDVASRRVMAHTVAITLAACHAKEVIEQAFVRHGSPQIVNVDQAATEFTEVVLVKDCKSAWTGVVPGVKACSSRGSGAASSTSAWFAGPTTASVLRAPTLPSTSNASMSSGRIRALLTQRPMSSAMLMSQRLAK